MKYYRGILAGYSKNRESHNKLLVRLCRMLHRLPDEIRAIDVNDFQLLFDDSMTVPYIDEAFYYAFGGGGAKKDKLSLSGPSTKEERRKVIQEIIKKKG